MRRRYFVGLAALLSLSFLGLSSALFSSDSASAVAADIQAPESKLAKSRIDRVTVYPNSALVTRTVDVPDGNGLIELVVNPMPDRIVPSTMYSEAAEGLRVLTTRFSTRQVFEDTSVERRKLEAEREQLQVLAAKIVSDISSVNMNMALLSKLENVTEKGKHTGDEVIAMTKYVMEQRTDKAKQLVAIMEEKRLNDVQMSFNQRKIGELGRGSGKMEREAVIVVDRENGKGGSLRLNYLVGSVTWRPEYKLRAGKINENVQVDYLASLMQHSGEDWTHVNVTLSTAQPTLEASPPELCMLEPTLIHRGQPGGPPMPTGGGFAASPFANSYSNLDLEKKAVGQRTLARANSAKGDAKSQQENFKLLNDASAIEQNLELMKDRSEVLAAAKNKKLAVDPTRVDGPSVTYHLPSKLSIPSRNNEQMVEIVKLKLQPKYYYKAVPVLNRHVYRLADLVNKSSHEFLPGEATMYQGSDFVGRMPMPLVAIGEEFTAGFGVDTQLQIQRQMIDQVRSTQGGNQVLKYDYRILISSYKSEPVKLQLWDRLPKAEAESVNIIMGKCTPDLSKDGIYLRESRPNNLLRWDVEVPANCSGENAYSVAYDFRMELDRQMAITGFQIR
jgi:Domain of unknown function (DUF4139)/N-terminal domain of unknown function (DUF4140)